MLVAPLLAPLLKMRVATREHQCLGGVRRMWRVCFDIPGGTPHDCYSYCCFAPSLVRAWLSRSHCGVPRQRVSKAGADRSWFRKFSVQVRRVSALIHLPPCGLSFPWLHGDLHHLPADATDMVSNDTEQQ